jgi:hypothetical protein
MVFLQERARLVEIHGRTLTLAKGKAHRGSGLAREVQILAPAAEGYCGALGGGNVPILQYGQSTELGAVRGVSATNGITCTITKGAGTGTGARVNKTKAVAVG